MNLTLKFLPTSYEGEMRYGMCPAAQNTRGTVLVLPGWGEWIEKYQECISEWNTRGYDVIIPEWRGQGLSTRFLIDRKKTWLPSFDILVDDLERLFKKELADKNKVSTKNILLFCHSMGAHVGLRWYLQRGRAYPAINLLSPAWLLRSCSAAAAPLPRHAQRRHNRPPLQWPPAPA